MQNKNQIIEEAVSMETMKEMAQAYEEISVSRMQNSRSSVLQNREFLEKLSQVYLEVKVNYKRQVEDILEKQKKKRLAGAVEHGKNGKTLSIFISSNGKLYGDIVYKVFRLFLENIGENDEIAIVGLLGKELFDEQHTGRVYQYFEVPDDQVTPDSLKPILSYLNLYSHVKVYYGKFSNVVVQMAVESGITGEEFLELESGELKKRDLFFFEPSLEEVLHVFETQVLSSLFQQTVHESQLSRYASRIRAMEEALENIDKRGNILLHEERRLKKQVENKKRLELLSGMSLWSR